MPKFCSIPKASSNSHCQVSAILEGGRPVRVASSLNALLPIPTRGFSEPRSVPTTPDSNSPKFCSAFPPAGGKRRSDSSSLARTMGSDVTSSRARSVAAVRANAAFNSPLSFIPTVLAAAAACKAMRPCERLIPHASSISHFHLASSLEASSPAAVAENSAARVCSFPNQGMANSLYSSSWGLTGPTASNTGAGTKRRQRQGFCCAAPPISERVPFRNSASACPNSAHCEAFPPYAGANSNAASSAPARKECTN
mmetsp:Transcript_18431/g.47111  ORF Transcript_18431/g.47111 Transcript_18431/m.47111 type:complete len:254 (+) Transcript_18431:962-1723(+)